MDHDIVGGVSNVLRELVLLLEEQKLLEGVHVRLPGEQDRFVRLKLRYLLADGEALRETWSWRGANAVKPCFKCKNVLKKENKACATNNYFLDIRVDTLDRCDRAGDAEIFDWIDSLRAKKDTLTEAAFEQECKLSGFNLTPGSILTDAAARSVLGPNASCFDPMHLYFTCGGLGCKESTLLVKRAKACCICPCDKFSRLQRRLTGKDLATAPLPDRQGGGRDSFTRNSSRDPGRGVRQTAKRCCLCLE